MSSLRLFGVVVAFLAIFSSPVYAQSAQVQVTTQLSSTCEIVSLPNISLGKYDSTQNDVFRAVASSFQIRCTAATAGVRVAIDEGQNASAESTCATPDRRMKDQAGNYLNYTIYKSSNQDAVFGCEAGVSDLSVPPSSFVYSSSLVSLSRYVVIPANQNAPLGSYTDTLGLSVSF